MSDRKTIKSVLESLMFVLGEPLEAKDAMEVLSTSEQEILECMEELQREYLERKSGMEIRRIENSFQLCTRLENGPYIERFCTPVKEKRLSQSAMEVLAIIAYRQPVTKNEIESIRGVRCDRVLEGLQKKGLIEEAGRSDAIGRPILYGTTRLFLEHFDLENLRDLPEIEDIDTLVQKEAEESDPQFQQISIELES